MTSLNLIYAMRETAHLYAATGRDDPEVRIFTRFDDDAEVSVFSPQFGAFVMVRQ